MHKFEGIRPLHVHRCLPHPHACFTPSTCLQVPRLLYTPDAVSSVQAAADKLVAIYPYRVADKREEVLKLVEEYPELLLRIPLYCQDRIQTVEDLPVDLQNRILKNYC